MFCRTAVCWRELFLLATRSGIILYDMPISLLLSTISPKAWNDLITRLDTAAFKYINSGFASPVMDHIMVAATITGGGTFQVAYCLGFILVGWICGSVDWRRAGYAGITAAAMSTVTVAICKQVWQRPRPLLAMFDVRIPYEPLFTNSFPSGHTMTAFAVAFACSVFVPKLRYILIPFAALTGFSRVYVGVHFPLDVLYGGLVGIFLGLAGASAVRHWAGKGPGKLESNETVAVEATEDC